MPWIWYPSKNPDLNMAECDTCHTWYHRKCENIPHDVFNKFRDRWNGIVQIVKKYTVTDDYDFRIILAEL